MFKNFIIKFIFCIFTLFYFQAALATTQNVLYVGTGKAEGSFTTQGTTPQIETCFTNPANESSIGSCQNAFLSYESSGLPESGVVGTPMALYNNNSQLAVFVNNTNNTPGGTIYDCNVIPSGSSNAGYLSSCQAQISVTNNYYGYLAFWPIPYSNQEIAFLSGQTTLSSGSSKYKYIQMFLVTNNSSTSSNWTIPSNFSTPYNTNFSQGVSGLAVVTESGGQPALIATSTANSVTSKAALVTYTISNNGNGTITLTPQSDHGALYKGLNGAALAFDPMTNLLYITANSWNISGRF